MHCHLVLFAAERTDGKLAAIESRQLYRTAREGGGWYRAELVAYLQELGLPIKRRTGRGGRYFEIRGVPEGLASGWSSRSEDVDRAARIFRQRYGREPRAGELGSLTIATRGSKSAADRTDVNEAWRAVGEEHPGGVSLLVGRAGTGKGVVLSTAARAWQLEGYEVIGTAVAGATAQRLKDDAKLDRSHTADGLINGVEKDRIHLGPRSVVVMDEAGMADTERLARLAKLTAESRSKLVLAGDAAQLSPIGAGGLFKQLEGRVPTAELTQVHRANHEWERRAWGQVRAGQPGPALAQYRAYDRLHVYDTRAQAAEAMVEGWEQARRGLPAGQAVMITDASNAERDQINAMAQERRAAAGELGSRRVELAGKPYGLAAGDEVIFSAQFPVPGQRRVENGITGTVVDTARHRDRVTIRTHEREPREVQVDTAKFNDLSLSYAVHVHKGQGITAEASGILAGGWQTDKERAYVAVSRAREQTQIYVSREDLGQQGMDIGAIERLAERMRRSGAREASISSEVDEKAVERQVRDRARPTARPRARDRVAITASTGRIQSSAESNSRSSSLISGAAAGWDLRRCGLTPAAESAKRGP